METINKEKNFISAVAYVYNDARFIQQFVEGLDKTLDENFLKYEIIIVNDKSSDDVVKIVEQYAKQKKTEGIISILNMSYHQGVEPSMNAGVDLSIGDFVYEFDSVYVDYDWQILMDIYRWALTGFDIVNAHSNRRKKLTSALFYKMMNKYSYLEYQLDSETLRILSRRAINRVHSMSKTIPYRKAIYANSGLKNDTLNYTPIKEIKPKKFSNRITLAIDSLILFTDLAYRFTFSMAAIMMLTTFGVAVYTLTYWLFETPVHGWTSTVLFLAFAFFALFAILAMVIKYLSMLVHLNFSKREYLFESIDKLQ